MRRWILALILLMLAVPGLAKEAAPTASDPRVEQRVARLSELLRCLVCQNQTIADSNAALAQDLRAQIREQIAAGKTDREITDYMVARYGDFVLYQPPMKSTTLVLWAGPFVLLAIGGAALYVHVRRRTRSAPEADMTDEERRRADALLGIGGGQG